MDANEKAREIVDLFEDVLDCYDITVPSPEDDQREEDNTARLYGSVYWDLIDAVETYLNKETDEKEPEEAKPMLVYDRNLRMGGCPKCKHALSSMMNYCPSCGQKVVWEGAVEWDEPQ